MRSFSVAMRQGRRESISALFKASLFRFLTSLSGGVLTLEESAECRHFGQQTEGLSELDALIQVRHAGFYKLVYCHGSIGAAEAYMLGYWTTPSLVDVVRLFSRNIDALNTLDGLGSWLQRVGDWLLLRASNNSISGSKKNISAHYDLSNQFFATFLSPDMMYSSAIYGSPDMPLQEASDNKLKTICDKLKLKSSDNLLEIGSGWGGMAIYAATHYGCNVTTTTISEEQFKYVNDLVKAKSLTHKITVLKRDYRELTGSYDKLVSIEMIEAVGANHYKQYFSKCNALLNDNGLMLIQAITVPNRRFMAAMRSVDFIKKYIFPGGCLPSNEVIEKCLRRYTSMQCIGLQDITADYALTIKAWRSKFNENKREILSQGYDELFIRMWDFYLCYCEGGFKERVIGTAQFVFAKNKYRF